MPLLTELKERKVFRVAAAYAVVAWLLIQVASADAGHGYLPHNQFVRATLDWYDQYLGPTR